MLAEKIVFSLWHFTGTTFKQRSLHMFSTFTVKAS